MASAGGAAAQDAELAGVGVTAIRACLLPSQGFCDGAVGVGSVCATAMARSEVLVRHGAVFALASSRTGHLGYGVGASGRRTLAEPITGMANSVCEADVRAFAAIRSEECVSRLVKPR